MAAKRVAFALCTLGFLQTSFAGFDRFWIFSKDADTQVSETWESLSEEEQRALIQRYQSLKELPDAQSDLFALGVTLYQLLTGRLPYGEVLPYQSGRYYRDPVAPSRISPEVPIWLDHIVLKAVARDKRRRFETAEELLLALERGASRPLTAPQASPLMQRDPTAVWKLALGVSLLFNFLLVYWLLFLPK